MKKILLAIFLLLNVFVFAQMNKKTVPMSADSLLILKKAVEANPNDIENHNKYIKGLGTDNSALPIQYEKWVKQFPKSAIVPFAIGEAYANIESPKAKPWLLKAVAIDPKMDKAYMDLWIDGERWGDFKGAQEYLKKAMDAAPTSPDYAFYYRSAFKSSDPEKYHQGMLEMCKLFPNSERGAQALYWLGLEVKDVKEKIEIYTLLKDSYPPEKSNWSSSGMYDFYYTNLQNFPDKAVELAKSMLAVSTRDADKKTWTDRIKIAQDLIRVNTLMADHKPLDAKAIIDQIPFERRNVAADMVTLLKSQIYDATGNTYLAYGNLVGYYALTPNDRVRKELMQYGKQLGKDEKSVLNDVWKVRDASAVQATPFTLAQYMQPGKSSLNDFKGKVILLTYWFPGCGPCRGEFPNFEHVIKKFSKDKVAYIGINVAADQDAYVVPFMKSSGYSFMPLKDEEAQRGNLVTFGQPTNYLLDKEGRIMYKNFRIDSSNEDMLEIMIKELMERNSTN